LWHKKLERVGESRRAEDNGKAKRERSQERTEPFANTRSTHVKEIQVDIETKVIENIRKRGKGKLSFGPLGVWDWREHAAAVKLGERLTRN